MRRIALRSTVEACGFEPHDQPATKTPRLQPLSSFVDKACSLCGIDTAQLKALVILNAPQKALSFRTRSLGEESAFVGRATMASIRHS